TAAAAAALPAFATASGVTPAALAASGFAASAFATAPAPFTAAAALRRRRALGHLLLALRGGVRAEVGLAEDLAPVDPHLDAGRAVDREGRGLGVVDVGAHGVERDA